MPATEAAFSKATRVTFFGSIIPAFKHIYIRHRFWHRNQNRPYLRGLY